VVLTTHPLLAPRSREYIDIPLPPLWPFESVTGYISLVLLILLLLAFHGRYSLHRNVSCAIGKGSPYPITARYHDFAVVSYSEEIGEVHLSSVFAAEHEICSTELESAGRNARVCCHAAV
jgi:hypothetical protein